MYAVGAGTEWTVEHAVGYPWPPEPTIGVSSLSDTYNQEGPFMVTAGTGDIDGDVVSAVLNIQKNGELDQSIDMTMLEKDSYEASFSVTAVPGDVFTYWGTATDNDGNTKDSQPVEFSVLEPTQPGADILLVYSGTITVDTLFQNILDGAEYAYEFWDANEHGGIDASVTNSGIWNTIILHGWGVDLPTRGYDGNAYAEFLNAGTDDTPRNLFMPDMDYFFSNGEVAEPVFEAGDFAYDLFQIGTGGNDPGDTFDSLLVGITDDPVSGSWDENLLYLESDLPVIANWIDWTEATGGGFDIFFMANQGFGAGVSYDAGNFKTVHLPWMVSWLVDSSFVDGDTTFVVNDDASTLVGNVLSFFGTEKGESNKVSKLDAVPRDFSLEQNYPNPFNPQTSINFTLPADMNVEIDIFNVVGQKIKTLVNSKVSTGSHVAIWDGRNDFGAKVSTGVYFYKLSAGDFTKTMKMIMVK
jgi:hypothetical protein